MKSFKEKDPYLIETITEITVKDNTITTITNINKNKMENTKPDLIEVLNNKENLLTTPTKEPEDKIKIDKIDLEKTIKEVDKEPSTMQITKTSECAEKLMLFVIKNIKLSTKKHSKNLNSLNLNYKTNLLKLFIY